jgi:hypothetical protein
MEIVVDMDIIMEDHQVDMLAVVVAVQVVLEQMLFQIVEVVMVDQE